MFCALCTKHITMQFTFEAISLWSKMKHQAPERAQCTPHTYRSEMEFFAQLLSQNGTQQSSERRTAIRIHTEMELQMQQRTALDKWMQNINTQSDFPPFKHFIFRNFIWLSFTYSQTSSTCLSAHFTVFCILNGWVRPLFHCISSAAVVQLDTFTV